MIDSLLSMLDETAAILDDIAALSKVAAKKTAGVVGDDLALNANQLTGVHADKELHVVWQVAKGSFLNKAILVPVALALSVFLPVAIVPLLVLGGLYLCFEGVEKVWHAAFHKPALRELETRISIEMDAPARQKEKIRGAVRTDFILSAEIIVISLGSVPPDTGFAKQAAALSVIAVGMTVGVYGLVALIVRLDDIGLSLSKSSFALVRALGSGIVQTAPLLMKGLSVVGTIAMFLVGGSILLHAASGIEARVQALAHGSPVAKLIVSGAELVLGVASGLVCLALVSSLKALKTRIRPTG
jgi:uncharacterized protein